jgi:hypothetical protein
VLTSCLGLCPKGAMTIAYAGRLEGLRLAGVRTLGEVERLMPLLLADPDGR